MKPKPDSSPAPSQAAPSAAPAAGQATTQVPPPGETPAAAPPATIASAGPADSTSAASSTPANDSGLAPVLSQVRRLFAEQEALQARPATDAQLALLWPLWHALPGNLSPGDKDRILHGGITRADRAHLAELRRRFPDYGFPLTPDPLCGRPPNISGKPPRRPERLTVAQVNSAWAMQEIRAEHHQALCAMKRWTEMIKYLQTTRNLHLERVKAELGWPNFDDVLTGRVAIYRAGLELEITRPGLLACSAPTLAQIDHLQSRYSAYVQARQDAINLISRQVFLSSLQAEEELPFSNRALGVPHPPPTLPRHLYIARLAALGLCSPAHLTQYMAKEFFGLTPEERLGFCREYDHPGKARQFPVYFRLQVWLLDNAPVFNACKARWPDIFAALKTHSKAKAPAGYTIPRSAVHLRLHWLDFAAKHGLNAPPRIRPPPGRPRKGAFCEIHGDLLTPPPFLPPAE